MSIPPGFSIKCFDGFVQVVREPEIIHTTQTTISAFDWLHENMDQLSLQERPRRSPILDLDDSDTIRRTRFGVPLTLISERDPQWSGQPDEPIIIEHPSVRELDIDLELPTPRDPGTVDLNCSCGICDYMGSASDFTRRLCSESTLRTSKAQLDAEMDMYHQY
jgi:hypothetical protein